MVLVSLDGMNEIPASLERKKQERCRDRVVPNGLNLASSFDDERKDSKSKNADGLHMLEVARSQILPEPRKMCRSTNM